MEPSILTSTKKLLGVSEAYTAFDLDIITHINSVFLILTNLGLVTFSGLLLKIVLRFGTTFGFLSGHLGPQEASLIT